MTAPLEARTDNKSMLVLRCSKICEAYGSKPCQVRGAPIEEGVCCGCWEPTEDCVCTPEDEEEQEDW